MWEGQKQTQLTVRVGLEPRESRLQVQCSNHSATLPPYLNKKILYEIQYYTNHYTTLNKQVFNHDSLNFYE